MSTTTPERVHHKPDEADRELLNQLQAGLAFVREPFAEIGTRIGMDEEEVLRRLDLLKRAQIVRQLSAIFDTRALGYESSLVAARYPDDKLFEGAAIVSKRFATWRAISGLSIIRPISVLRSSERGSRFADPMNTRLRSNTNAFACSAN